MFKTQQTRHRNAQRDQVSLDNAIRTGNWAQADTIVATRKQEQVQRDRYQHELRAEQQWTGRW